MTKEEREYFEEVSDPSNYLKAAGPGLLVYSASVSIPTEAILSSSFLYPMLSNALYGGVSSTAAYYGISRLSGQTITLGGLTGSFTSGAIAGAVGTLATPLAGSVLKPIGVPLNAGTSIVNGISGVIAYHYGGAVENVVNEDLGYEPSLIPSSRGYTTSFIIPAALSPIASSNFPVKSVNSLNQASYFIPGRTPNTWLTPNNLHQQNIFSIIAGALLGDAFGENQ